MVARSPSFLSATCLAIGLLAGSFATAAQRDPVLEAALLPWARIAAGGEEQVLVSAEVELLLQGETQVITCSLNRHGNESFDLKVTHPEYAVEVRRREDWLALLLPKHGLVYLGTGPCSGSDSLAPANFLQRICGPATQAATYLSLVSPEHPEAIVQLALRLANLKQDADSGSYRAGELTTLTLLPENHGLLLTSRQARLKLLNLPSVPLSPAGDFGDLRVVTLPRAELETQLARGVARGVELLLPGGPLVHPPQTARSVPNGELRWIEGQRVVLLSGTPEEIGTAHGQLLREEALRCQDSVLNVFGTLQTVRTGRWFRDDLRAAAARLLPHIPERHRQETRALAMSLQLDPAFVEELNVFPELFHCSGFAVMGSATRDGKLYHGRVLDYMTMIGLQDAAATFVIAANGQIPFVSVGYAAFIGSVSGMNAETISLGEMGGHGEGAWDGVPMATLMRRALEECRTLDEVVQLWAESPRTCEYYYVFAEGKSRRAVGVAARPDALELVQPGEAHPLLGAGIPDAVVLSAGGRLEALRARVLEKHGQIDAATGQWLMCRPVAMKSNLHNVLFVPEDGVLYVANADHVHPAAERPYVQLNLHELLSSMTKE